MYNIRFQFPGSKGNPVSRDNPEVFFGETPLSRDILSKIVGIMNWVFN